MSNAIIVKKKINPFNNTISVSGDKSLSIRWALLASQAKGKSKAFNLLNSLDVLSTLNSLKILGVKVKIKKKYCEIESNGINTFKNDKRVTINAGNSGTFSRLILGLLIHHNKIVHASRCRRVGPFRHGQYVPCLASQRPSNLRRVLATFAGRGAWILP